MNVEKCNVVIVSTPKELGQAIKEEKDTIEITGDLAKKVVRIKATGKIAWTIAIGAIGCAVYFIVSTPATAAATAPVGGVGATVSFTGSAVSLGAAGTVLGTSAITALGIAVVAGGVGALTTLRDKYKIHSKEHNKLVLKRK